MAKMKTVVPVSTGDTLSKVGSWSFIGGVIIALISGFLAGQAWIVPTLAVLGIIVGLLNISREESQPFLLAAVAIVVVTSLGGAGLAVTPIVGAQLQVILTNIMVFVLPASIIVALREIYDLAMQG